MKAIVCNKFGTPNTLTYQEVEITVGAQCRIRNIEFNRKRCLIVIRFQSLAMNRKIILFFFLSFLSLETVSSQINKLKPNVLYVMI